MTDRYGARAGYTRARVFVCGRKFNNTFHWNNGVGSTLVAETGDTGYPSVLSDVSFRLILDRGIEFLILVSIRFCYVKQDGNINLYESR